MVNGSGRKLLQTRRRAAAPLIFYIRADSPMRHLRDRRASTPPVLSKSALLRRLPAAVESFKHNECICAQGKRRHRVSNLSLSAANWRTGGTHCQRPEPSPIHGALLRCQMLFAQHVATSPLSGGRHTGSR
jgi:hypothetical protein